MSLSVIRTGQAEFKQGFQAGISIGIGYLPIALTYGLIAKTTGLTLVETVLMSIVVFAGAAQYIALQLIAIGTGAFEIILTTFIVNIRHFLMTASLGENVEKDHPIKKAIYSFGITDETFSIAATRGRQVSTSYMFGLISISYGSWVINSGLGFLIGANLPGNLQQSMSVALYAMFIGLLIPSMKKQRKIIYLAATAGVLNSLFMFGFSIPAGWSIVLATVFSAIGLEYIIQRMNKGEVENG